jgi:hypothetical protein
MCPAGGEVLYVAADAGIKAGWKNFIEVSVQHFAHMAKADEAVNMIAFLGSDAASDITWPWSNVDGGGSRAE